MKSLRELQAIRDKMKANVNTRDGMEGKLARVALSFLSIFGGLVIFCLYQAEILAWLHRTRTQKEDNCSDGA